MGGNDDINQQGPSAPPMGFAPEGKPQQSGYVQQPPQPGYVQQPQPGYVQAPPPGYIQQQQPGYAQPPGGYIQPAYVQPPQQPLMVVPLLPVAGMPLGTGQDPLLEGLLAFPSLLLKQNIRDLCVEMYCRWAQSNSYSIFNPGAGAGWHNQKILHVKEESNCLERFCFRSWRGLTLRVLTADDREAILIDRPFHPCSKGGCFCYCSDVFYQVIDVYSGKDTQFGNAKLGRVKQNFSFFQPYLTIFDANGEEVYKLLANCISCGRRSFRIFRAHEQNMEKKNQIGKIRKKWGGFAKEFLTNCDNFSIRFPVDSNHIQRALIVATCLFIDYLYYENSQTPAQQMSNNF